MHALAYVQCNVPESMTTNDAMYYDNWAKRARPNHFVIRFACELASVTATSRVMRINVNRFGKHIEFTFTYPLV